MSTANKLTYLNTTKQKLKQAINNIGGEVTDETTFREYTNQLQEVYDRLPKTAYAEGSNITLENTLKGKLDFEDGIVGIGDIKQEIDLTENNLTSQSANGLTITVNTDKSITINGTASADTKINILNNTIGSTAATERTVEAGTYQLTGCPSGSSSGTKFTLQVLRSGYIMLEDTGSGAVNTITSSQTYTYIRIIVFSGTQCNNLVFRPKLLKIPSPSYPQEIEVVRGKNLSKEKNGNNIVITDELPVGTYTFSLDNTINGGCNLKANDNSGTTLASMYFSTEGRKTITFTLSQSTKIFINGFSNTSGTTFVDGTDNFQLEKGPQATSYLPFNTIEVKARGKNLADNSKLVNGYMTAEGIWHYGSGNEHRSTDLIEVKEGKTYTSSLYNKNKEMIAYLVWTTYDKNKNFIAQYTTSNIVISSGVKYIRARNYQAQTSYIINDDYLYQVEENNTPTNYEPYYTPQIKQLSLGEYEFAKIGNYADTIEYDVDEDKVYKNGAIGKVDLATQIFQDWNNNLAVCTTIPNIKYTSSNTEIGFGLAENYKIHQGSGMNSSSAYGCIAIDVSQVSVNPSNSTKAISGLFYYALATPTKTEITGTLKDQIKALYNLQSFTGTTIIEIDGQLPLIIKVRALKGN